jgi:hypothetical protein
MYFYLDRTSCRLRDNVENTLQPGRPQMTIWHMRTAFWVPKATYLHSEYVIPIAFPLQQWWHERVSMLRCTYVVCLVLLPLYIQHTKHIYFYDNKRNVVFFDVTSFSLDGDYQRYGQIDCPRLHP